MTEDYGPSGKASVLRPSTEAARVADTQDWWVDLLAEDFDRARRLSDLVEIGPDEKGDSHLCDMSDARFHKPTPRCGCNPDFLGGEGYPPENDTGFWSHHTSKNVWLAFVLGAKLAATREPSAEADATGTRCGGSADALNQNTSEVTPDA